MMCRIYYLSNKIINHFQWFCVTKFFIIMWCAHENNFSTKSFETKKKKNLLTIFVCVLVLVFDVWLGSKR